MIDLETPEKIPTIPVPQDHKRADDELEKIRKELHNIGEALRNLVKVESRKR